MFFGSRTVVTVLLLAVLNVSAGCATPPIPSEVAQATQKERGLWKEGAETYASKEYDSYKASLRRGADMLVKENARFGWFRNYKNVTAEYRKIITEGEQVEKLLKERKSMRAAGVADQLALLKSRTKTITRLSTLVNEGRVCRKHVSTADVILAEASKLYDTGRYPEAEQKLKDAVYYVDAAANRMRPILSRFTDKNQITKWRAWVNETVAESKRSGGYAIIVDKIDKTLYLYRDGQVYKTYDAGIGLNGARDKMFAGDRATPEGRYRVVKKVPNSKYHKALLINYPNDEDRRQFAQAKSKGLIPRNVGIGNLIEIHGGGSMGMTYGCVGLDNSQMDELYRIVESGTPVTIVGSSDFDNRISNAVKEL